MAKKPAPSKAVAKVESKAVSKPSKYAGMGQESIDADDIYMPRLKLGQAMTPEVKDGDLSEGDFFNSITGEVICPAGESIPVIIILHTKEYILWDDRKGDNRGMLARAMRVKDGDDVRYRWNKPNATFEVKVDGKTKVKYKTSQYIDEDKLNEWGTQIPGNEESPPAANEHQNYILAFPTRDYEMIALSLSKTSIGAAKKLNTNLKFGEAAIFERLYKLSSYEDNRGENKFANVAFSTTFERVDDDVADRMYQAHIGLVGRNIIVDQDNEDDAVDSKKGGASSSKKF
jgi:hypothetical protein